MNRAAIRRQVWHSAEAQRAHRQKVKTLAAALFSSGVAAFLTSKILGAW